MLGNEEALDCMFKVLRTGMQWREIESTVSYATVHRRMASWNSHGPRIRTVTSRNESLTHCGALQCHGCQRVKLYGVLFFGLGAVVVM